MAEIGPLTSLEQDALLLGALLVGLVVGLVVAVAFARRIGGARIDDLTDRLHATTSDLEDLRKDHRRLHDDLTAERMTVARLHERAGRVQALEQETAELRDVVSRLRNRLSEQEARADKDREAAAEKIALLEQAEVRLRDVFKSLSNDALAAGSEHFLKLAQQQFEKFQLSAEGDYEKRRKTIAELVAPLQQSLEDSKTQAQHLERQRQEAYGQLTAQVKALADGHRNLHDETQKLVGALRSPQTKGRWGEIQLKRVVEMAGMLDHVDFFEQESHETDEGRSNRPDMIVRLPGDKRIVVDAKAPTGSFLDVVDAESEADRRAALLRHGRLVRNHAKSLAGKAYWKAQPNTPEFVVMFLPGENFFSAALEIDPELIQFGVDNQVVIATPTTLIALLRSVAFGWRQEALSDNAKKIAEEGRRLYERLAIFGGHFERIGRHLSAVTDSYNRAISSFDKRVLPSARQFETLGSDIEAKSVPLPKLIEDGPQRSQAPEIASERQDDGGRSHPPLLDAPPDRS